ncbi:MAG: hypothetical protein LBM06_03130 [Prevotellaceae bacterium]|jgi:hypothetical protein|nr:hypothetical protein [Prevotellaceae bacterium]
MKSIRILFVFALLFSFCSAFTLKKEKNKTVYAFGVAASFNDTVVYFTDIQSLDSVKLGKENFLPQREQYTYQLKNYLAYYLQKANYTCMIYFSESRNKLTKEYTKMQNNYRKNSTVVLTPLPASSFTFKRPEQQPQP